MAHKGVIGDIIRALADGVPFFGVEFERLQNDSVALSLALTNLAKGYLLPKIHTADNKLAYTTSADTVTLAADQEFTIAGVRFNTTDLVSLDFIIPADSTKYLRAKLADDCGLVEAYDVDQPPLPDPINRYRTVDVYLSDDGSATTADDLLILKAVQGTAGTVPTVTAYGADGQVGGSDLGLTVFASSGTYTVPDGVYRLLVEVFGGGAGGSSSSRGGAGGGYALKLIDVEPGEVITVTVASEVSGGVNGETSSFGSYVSATGGLVANNGGTGVGGDTNLTGQTPHSFSGIYARWAGGDCAGPGGPGAAMNINEAGQAPGGGGSGENGSTGYNGARGEIRVYAIR